LQSSNSAAAAAVLRGAGSTSLSLRWLQTSCASNLGSTFFGKKAGGMTELINGSSQLLESFGLDRWQQVRWSGSLKAKGKPRGPLWRQRKGISKEAMQVVFDLKRAKGDWQKEQKVLQTEASRLLKMDLLMTLVELRRQDECALAIQIFEMVRKEPWYKPDQFLYREMMDTLGRNQLIEEVERLYKDLQDEGLKPDAMILTELMGAYIRCDKVPRAFELYQEMKSSELQLEKVTYEILCRGLKKARDFEHLQIVIDDCRQAFPGLVPPYSKQMDAHSTGDREKSHA